MPALSTANPPVSVRVSPGERDLLEAAAAQARTSLSDFVRRKALEAAEMDLLDRRIVTIPAAACVLPNWLLVFAYRAVAVEFSSSFCLGE